MRESHLQRLFFFSCQICADNRNSLHLLCPEMRAGSCSLILLGLQLWSSVSLFLLYLEIAVLALSDSALVLPIFAEPLTVVTSKVSNSKPALYINYQSHQKNLGIIKSERIWGNRPDRGTHVQRQPKPAIQVFGENGNFENGKRQGRRKLPLPFLLSIASSITAYC